MIARTADEPRTRINPRKLLLSKWTALKPQNKEIHFMVVKIHQPDDVAMPLEWIDLEAVITRRVMRIAWRELLDLRRWQQGWQ